MPSDGSFDKEIKHRIQSGWRNWKNNLGVLYKCDKWISACCIEQRYGPLKRHEKKLEVAEMRVLRWMCGVTKYDRIRNEKIRGQHGLSLTLKFRAKVKFENIFKFLGYDFLYHFNTIFALKPIVKKLLSIETVIFYICTFGSIIGKISVTGSCLEQTWERTS
jgi:hypothetical protein